MVIPIKRYPNRKLYNTEAKKYITLEEIWDLIRDDHDIIVNDSVSGEDITTIILTQVIVGQEKKRGDTLPQGLLTGLIRARIDTLDGVKRWLHEFPSFWSRLSAYDIPTRDDYDKLRDQIELLNRAIEAIASENKESDRS